MEITEKDVGRRFKTRDGRIFIIEHIAAKQPTVTYPVRAVDMKDAQEHYFTLQGAWATDGLRNYDLVERLEEGSKMGQVKITEKDVGRFFKIKDGRTFNVVKIDKQEPEFEVLALVNPADVSLEKDNFITLTAEGRYYEDGDGESLYDFAEWVTKQDNKMDEQDRYELRMTVVDVKGSATTYKKYLPFLAGLREIVDKKTGGIIDVGSDEGFNPLLAGQLKSKGDVVKITRQVNALGANLATLTIRVTRLKD